jgi:quinol monooxygenase YgiN
MISFIVRLTFSPDDRAEVAEILRALTLASRQEPGCVTYIPHYLDGDRDKVLIYEQYRDEAAAEAHRQSPHFKQYAVGGLYQKMKDRAREDLAALA